MSAAGPCDGMNASPPTAQATINAAASFIAKEVRKKARGGLRVL